MSEQLGHFVEAAQKTAPAVVPAFGTVAANWLGIINTGLGVVLMALSIAFLIWRWRVADKKENE